MLGQINEVKEITSPDVLKEYEEKGHGDGKKFIQECETMELSEKTKNLFKIIKELWT